jgi:hypothetical protein
VANEPTPQLVPRRLCVLPAPTVLWVTSSHIQPRIRSTILGSVRKMMVRNCAQMQEASRRWKHASKSFNRTFTSGFSGSSNILRYSKTVLLVCWPITIKVLLRMRMWLGNVNLIALWILPLQTLWPIWCFYAAAQLQITHCEDGMHWLNGCSTIWIVVGHFSGNLEGAWMGNNLEFFGEVLGLSLVFCVWYH